MPVITALYAGLLGLMAIAIGSKAGLLRGKLDIAVGDGGHPDLLLAMRRHANFAEWVPLALILIGLLEASGASGSAVHGLGAGLVAARASHAISLRGDTTRGLGRFAGAAGTALVIAVASVWCIIRFAVA